VRKAARNSAFLLCEGSRWEVRAEGDERGPGWGADPLVVSRVDEGRWDGAGGTRGGEFCVKGSKPLSLIIWCEGCTPGADSQLVFC